MDVGNDHEDEEIAFVYSEDNSDDSSLLVTEPLPNATACATPQPPSIANRRPHWSTYDPFSPGATSSNRPIHAMGGSLLDQEEDGIPPEPTDKQQRELEDFLEMEEDDDASCRSKSPAANQNLLASPHPPEEPIVTSSGLLLTHRKTPISSHSPLKPNEHFMSPLPRNLHRERFEVEAPGYNKYNHGNQIWSIWRRRVSLVWIWLGLSAVIFFVGTAVLWHHVSAVDQKDAAESSSSMKNRAVVPEQMEEQYANRIVLLPMDTEEGTENQQMMFPPQPQKNGQNMYMYAQQPTNLYNLPHRRLSEWEEAFGAWAQRHGKAYETEEERKYRLQVWMENHHRTAAKNEKHGDCPLMQRPVFGNANHFQDLTQEEFRSQYLNAQRKPRKLQSPHNRGTLGPHLPTRRHADVHHRIVQQEQERHVRPRAQKTYNCKWYDVSCNLRYIIEKYFYGYFGVGRTMEPAYDADSYPNSVDWREYGAVTDVRSQDNCGACWAITAVETLESAVFLATGELMTLSETEVILCAEDCQMCAGGWPENAFEYIMENKGIPSQNDLTYDGSYLLKISNVAAGESDELSNSEISAYKQKVCPAGGSGDSKDSGSKDSNDEGNDDNGGDDNANDDYWSPYNFARYGDILAGYGYATEPCVCYTDGSGCSCDAQDENTAVRNIATYGPAVVCVDASEWQDYDGGILTSSSGCSPDYLDVNHCVQVVGYAFSSSEGDNSGSGDRNSGDEHNSGDSNDREDRNLGSGSGDKDASYDGYWIVRNQWSEYWGMNGYAYVKLGENTCGILNDMLQVYTE